MNDGKVQQAVAASAWEKASIPWTPSASEINDDVWPWLHRFIYQRVIIKSPINLARHAL